MGLRVGDNLRSAEKIGKTCRMRPFSDIVITIIETIPTSHKCTIKLHTLCCLLSAERPLKSVI